MKVGVRKPSVSKRVKARTTGRAKRAVKKAVVPYYGQKGTGIIKDPKKAVYNKVYRKTTVGVDDIIAAASSGKGNKRYKKDANYTYQPKSRNQKTSRKGLKTLAIVFFILAVLGLLAEVYSILALGLITGFILWHSSKKSTESAPEDAGTISDDAMVSAYNDVDDNGQIQVSVEVNTLDED